MNALVILLAVIGLVLLVLLAVGALTDQASAPPPEPDLAAPYRQGLHAAIRLQGVAQDLEQELYAEAARQAKAEASESHTKERP